MTGLTGSAKRSPLRLSVDVNAESATRGDNLQCALTCARKGGGNGALERSGARWPTRCLCCAPKLPRAGGNLARPAQD